MKAAASARISYTKTTASWKVFLLPLLIGATVVGGLTVFTARAFAETHVIKVGARYRLQFQPNTLTIKPGDTVVWQVDTLPPHNIIFDPIKNPTQDSNLASSLSSPGLMMKVKHKVQTVFPPDAPAGRYEYYCEVHRGAGETGTIIVAP